MTEPAPSAPDPRSPCAECGIPFPPARLSDLDGRRLCPRCFALVTPAGTGQGREGREARESPTVREGPGSRETTGGGDAGREPGGVGRAGRRDGEISIEDFDAREAAPEAGRSASPAGSRPDRASADAPTGSRRVPAGPLTPLVGSIREWAGGRNWWIRAPLLLWLAWTLVQYWAAPWHRTIFHGIDLAVHEIGHMLWSPLGEFMGFAGGTLTQLLVPVAAAAVLYRQRDWFGVAVCVAWVGINCFEIVEYAGDALTRRLPLVSPVAAEPEHDWTYMLGRLGILHHTDAVAAAWQWAGRLFMSAGIAFGAWLLWLMATTEPEAGS